MSQARTHQVCTTEWCPKGHHVPPPSSVSAQGCSKAPRAGGLLEARRTKVSMTAEGRRALRQRADGAPERRNPIGSGSSRNGAALAWRSSHWKRNDVIDACGRYRSVDCWRHSSDDGRGERNPGLPVTVREPRHSLRHYCEFRSPRAWKINICSTAAGHRLTGWGKSTTVKSSASPSSLFRFLGHAQICT